ncbi:MAG: anaerobic ribonucleoside-triphosphate reductase activating protein [Alphaproteobacteria bacterium]|nr:anaerobic ribonucleoside-triphosphate reductase activating protein [Alphaproteobacteria bacterium]
MKYHNVTTDDMLNGDGLRVVLWVAGCEHHCPGCHNPVTWDENGGLDFDFATVCEIQRELNKPYISGITFSGGDPLHPCNREQITILAKQIKEAYPDKTIWLYTGYSWSDIKDLQIMQYIDVLVDGRFVESLKDVNVPWCGSTNQNIINVQQSLLERKLVPYISK